MESDAKRSGGEAEFKALRRWDRICDEFEAAWTSGKVPDCRQFLNKVAPEERGALLAYLLPIELECRHASASPATLDALLRAYPEYYEAVSTAWESHRGRDSAANQAAGRRNSSEGYFASEQAGDSPSGSGAEIASVDKPIESARVGSDAEAVRPSDPAAASRSDSSSQKADSARGASSSQKVVAARSDSSSQKSPAAQSDSTSRPNVDVRSDSSPFVVEKIGRYTILGELGRGGFAIVYLAHDPKLGREVALKIPRPDKEWSTKDLNDFAAEARRTVGLKGKGILTIHDLLECTILGRPSACVIQEYLNGENLQKWLSKRSGPIAPDTIAKLIAQIAEILDTAHRQGFIHRDVKPDNILMDTGGRPHLLDFGLALHVSERTRDEQRMAGSIPYMAPEQIRGETHRVEPATDVWSLGIILYQMLTGAKPFVNASRERLFRAIKYVEPAPPRRLAPACPAELERICLKCLAKPIADRYTSALQLAHDLRHWREAEQADGESLAGRGQSGGTDAEVFGKDQPLVDDAGSESGASQAAAPPTLVQPKGLSAYEASDAGAFLDLLPGPRGRDRLPESVRFWKQRLEEDGGFAVGMLFGPSGCGKSSFFKAGVLPRIDRRIASVFIESTAQDLENQLLAALRAQFPELPSDVPLVEAFEGLREGRWDSEAELDERQGSTRRVVVVLDQFEQWLHGNRSEFRGPLSEALRQCDGRRLRVVLLVRDDFWTPLTEFLRVLEVRSVEGLNLADLQLFDPTHARKVLATFGAAYGRLPLDLASLDAAQEEFLDTAVEELAENGKADGVRLSLFAEMMKDVPWTTASLRELGGLRGLGVLFLERSLGDGAAAAAKPLTAAAIGLLSALLPPVGGTLKGRRRSARELALAAELEYGGAEFRVLMDLLRRQFRLITPVDDQGSEPTFQLTHDYLVPSLRAWIRRKKLESASGRASLRLEERCASWLDRPENRQLPTLLESLRIATLTRPASWSGDEWRMMRRAGRVHSTRALVLGVLLAAVTASGWGTMRYVSNSDAQNKRSNIREALASLELCEGDAVRIALFNLEQHPEDLVRREIETRLAAKKRSAARLALLFGQAKFGTPPLRELIQEAMTAPGAEGVNFFRALQPHREQSLAILKQEASLLESATQSHPKARLAILAFCLGDVALAEQMGQLAPDPTWRTSLIAQFGEFNALSAARAEVVESSANAALRSAICLGIGGMTSPKPSDELRAEWLKRLETWHATSPSGLLHSASGWALGQWGSYPEPKPSNDGPQSERDWFVNTVGQTFVRIPAGLTTRKDADQMRELARVMEELRMADEPTATLTASDDEFWMSDSEVTSVNFFEFYSDTQVPSSDRLTRSMPDTETPPGATAPHPMANITFADAALFCNWLSQREGRMPCYERTGQMLKQDRDERISDLWRVRPKANGYRLPWAAEWIRACRAGTTTEFSFGNHDQRLKDYGVFLENSKGVVASVRSRRCNGWGLFDMHGNLFEWCNDRAEPNSHRYIVQGGCFTGRAGDCAVQPGRKESARRGALTRSPLLGMRLVVRP
ncbi:MAG: protein kinase domain-containing protein [Planctomycetota bacterium]